MGHIENKNMGHIENIGDLLHTLFDTLGLGMWYSKCDIPSHLFPKPVFLGNEDGTEANKIMYMKLDPEYGGLIIGGKNTNDPEEVGYKYKLIHPRGQTEIISDLPAVKERMLNLIGTMGHISDAIRIASSYDELVSLLVEEGYRLEIRDPDPEPENQDPVPSHKKPFKPYIRQASPLWERGEAVIDGFTIPSRTVCQALNPGDERPYGIYFFENGEEVSNIWCHTLQDWGVEFHRFVQDPDTFFQGLKDINEQLDEELSQDRYAVDPVPTTGGMWNIVDTMCNNLHVAHTWNRSIANRICEDLNSKERTE